MADLDQSEGRISSKMANCFILYLINVFRPINTRLQIQDGGAHESKMKVIVVHETVTLTLKS